MNYIRFWQNFLVEANETDSRLTPAIVVTALDIYLKIMADFNDWLSAQNQTEIIMIRPVGSIADVQKDLQSGTEAIYDSVKYLAELPAPPDEDSTKTSRNSKRAVRKKYWSLFFEFLTSPASTPGGIDVAKLDKRNPFMIRVEAHPGIFVDIETVTK